MLSLLARMPPDAWRRPRPALSGPGSQPAKQTKVTTLEQGCRQDSTHKKIISLNKIILLFGIAFGIGENYYNHRREKMFSTGSAIAPGVQAGASGGPGAHCPF
jgi:aminoglycoside N3'-acetyltransferase